MRQRDPGGPAAHIAGLLDDLRPALERIHRGGWRILVMGPTTATEREEARTFHARLLDAIAATCRAAAPPRGRH